MKFIAYIILIAVFWAMLSCATEGDSEEEAMITEVRISLDSVRFQRVYDFIDHWQQDSLLPYLSHKDPSFRVLATYGFAGMLDDKYVDDIGRGILDPIKEVRRASAYTLGQSYSSSAIPHLMKVFEYQDSMGIDPLTFKYALEAVGKCADSSYLSLLAGISTYQPGDTLLLEGLSLGILKMAERGFSDTSATSRMVSYVIDRTYGSSVRLIASNYLAFLHDLDLSAYHDSLKKAFENEPDPEIRMFLAKAMGRTGNKAGYWIRQALKTEEDNRVRIELLRGSVSLPLAVSHGIWAVAIRDTDDLVARTAADLILEYGSQRYGEMYTNWAFSGFKPAVYSRILATGNKYISNARFRQMVQELIFQQIRSITDPYVRSDFIMAAGQRLETAAQLVRFDHEESPEIVRTSILEALVNAVNISGSIGALEKQFLLERWKSGDVAALCILSPFFVANKALFPALTADSEKWADQSKNIKMPQGVEARIAVDKARKELFGFEYDPRFYRKEALHSHPIDWNLYAQLSDQPRADIVTSAGTMSILLFKEKAPATVLNFIELAESGYYNGLVIHRVVPNFVIQGGDKRGDGYGSMDYTIRSELGPLYYDQTGLIGMASAGLHTESQQWFITLRPALHLNGKYTQFAQLTEGEEVLMAIRRGDKIENIKIYK